MRTTPRPLHSAVINPRTSASALPARPLTVDGSSNGSIFATSPSTDCLSDAGRTHARIVTSTMNSGKIEKIPQNAIIEARFVLRSSENFLNVAIATPAGLLCRWVRSTVSTMRMSLAPLVKAAPTPVT